MPTHTRVGHGSFFFYYLFIYLFLLLFKRDLGDLSDFLVQKKFGVKFHPPPSQNKESIQISLEGEIEMHF